jgi:hypothetical protein
MLVCNTATMPACFVYLDLFPQFPEFRVLFHAIDLYPWASISSIENDDVMDALSRRTQAQVMLIRTRSFVIF